jgi:predicted RecA/RadA family phage recombinase
MKNFIAPGHTVTITAAAAVESGGVVQVGSLLGVAQADAAIGERVALATEGIFDIEIPSASAVATGKRIVFIGGVASLDATDAATAPEYATAIVAQGASSSGGVARCAVKINV